MRIPCLIGVAALAASPAFGDSACLLATETLGASAQAERDRAAERPDDAGARGRLAMRLDARGRDAAAAACYAEAAGRAPREARWPYLRARVLSRTGRIGEALEAVRIALDIEPGLTPALLLEAELLRLIGDFEGSLASARKALEDDPRSAPARFAAGQALAALGRDQEAVGELERAVEREARFAQARYALALAYRRAGRLEDARRELEIHRRLGQAPPVEAPDPYRAEVLALADDAMSLALGGVLLVQSHATESGRELLERALARDSTLAFAHAHLVQIYGQTDLTQAERHYREAIALDPSQVEARLYWGRALRRHGRNEAAIESLRSAVAVGPYVAEARVELGETLEALDRTEEAVDQYRFAYESNPVDGNVAQRLGAALLAVGRIEEGLDVLERTVDTGDGRAAEYLEALARDYQERGERRIALGYARRALARASEDQRAELIEPLEALIEALSDEAVEP